MKKRILVAIASLILAALILLLLPKPSPSQETVTTTVPGISVPTQPGSSSGTQPEDPGAVRLYCCDMQLAALFVELASEYTAETGVEVMVYTPDEDGCQATLQRLMQSEDPPTMFCVHSQNQLLAWRNTLLDLDGTAVSEALVNDGLGLRVDSKLLAIPVDVDGYGLLVNAEVLALKAAMTRNNDFGSLSALSIAVQVLANNSVKAFPAAVPTYQDAWYLLTQEDLTDARTFWDLYLDNSNKSGDPMTQFLEEKSAFYLSGTWDYDTLSGMTGTALDVMNLDILPTYSAGAMQYICSAAWCVNASARQQDMDVTLAFMEWMICAQEDAPAPVDRLGILSPFEDAAWYGNQIEKKLRGYMASEGAVIQWACSEADAQSLLSALNAYSQDRTDENWQQVLQISEQIRAEYGYSS